MPNNPAASRLIIRQALPRDVRDIYALVDPYAQRGILVIKEIIEYFESIQEFVVAEIVDSIGTRIVGCGALHVMWDNIAEIRTLAVHPAHTREGIGEAIVLELMHRAHTYALDHVFCLTFQKKFFERFGFKQIEGAPVGVDVFAEMLRSRDQGIGEFLDLARYKPNTLGNSRMLANLKELTPPGSVAVRPVPVERTTG